MTGCVERLRETDRQGITLSGIRGVGRCYLAKIRAWQRGAQFAPDIAFADTDVVHDARAILALDERIASLDGEHATELDADGRAMNGSASGCRRQCYDDRLALPRYL